LETALPTPLTSSSARPEAISAEMFDVIVRQHQRRVYRVIFLLVRDADAADTLTQECFLRAYQKRDSFRGECRVETWLLRIAVNLVRDHAKSRRTSFWKKFVGINDSDRSDQEHPRWTASEPSPERLLLAREKVDALWTAVQELSEQQRTIFVLRHVEELSLAEIAQTLGLKVGSVKAQLSRATGKLRQQLEGQSWK
jgi:RNA polymerase sigma-70 factor (ECF subfamily)